MGRYMLHRLYCTKTIQVYQNDTLKMEEKMVTIDAQPEQRMTVDEYYVYLAERWVADLRAIMTSEALRAQVARILRATGSELDADLIAIINSK